MSLTYSTLLPLGTIAPDFSLPDVVSGKTVALQQLHIDKGLVIVFMCNHCPYVKHILPALLEVARTYQAKGITFVAISANDVNGFPEDAPEKMATVAKSQHFPFPYLYDESQEVARAYQAVCTPDLYLFDSALECVYRGRFDAATPGNGVPVTGADLCAAMDQLLAGASIDAQQHPGMGCNIKWKPAT